MNFPNRVFDDEDHGSFACINELAKLTYMSNKRICSLFEQNISEKRLWIFSTPSSYFADFDVTIVLPIIENPHFDIFIKICTLLLSVEKNFKVVYDRK